MNWKSALAISAVAITATVARRVETVFQLDKVDTWFENLAVRASGEILATRIDVPEVWSIDPFTRSGHRLVTFPDALNTTGIAELRPDIFVVATINVTLGAEVIIGPGRIWELDLTREKPHTRLIGAYPKTGVLNGVTKWNDETVLVADSLYGLVYKVDVRSGELTVALSDPDTMTATPTGGSGVNGVKVLDSFVYFTSSARGLFCRVPVDDEAGVTGPAEVLSDGLVILDDFALTNKGTAYLTTRPGNAILKRAPDGNLTTLAGRADSPDVAGDTSCQFGRTEEDADVLYVTTGGAAAASGSQANGTAQEPAKVVALITDAGCD